jgi:hypothetical protein
MENHRRANFRNILNQNHAAEKKVHPLKDSASIDKVLKSGSPKKAQLCDKINRRRKNTQRLTAAIVTLITVGIDMDPMSLAIVMQMVLCDVLWIFACVGPDPRQGD